MQLRRVSGCCCGCSLRTGAVAFATVYLVLALLGFLRFLLQMVGGIAYGYSTHEYGAGAGSIIYAIFNSVLLYGLAKQKPIHLRIWIIFQWTMIAFATVGIVALIALFALDPVLSVVWNCVLISLLITLHIVLPYYSILVVNSYYNVMKGEKSEEEASPLPYLEKGQMDY